MFVPMRTMLRLPGTILALCASLALCNVLDVRSPQSTTVPAPLSISPDENWDGIDGAWSSFTLQVGTPPQYVRTFVSWASYQTWVVLDSGCSYAADTASCAMTRGGTFNFSASTSWTNVGVYDLWIERNLDYDGDAQYGYDVVGLGGQGENGPVLKNTTVGAFAVTDFYLGVFGVDPKPTNFTSFNDPSPSYMTLLKEQGFIPSLSFGYTAGAKYRFTGELASLTLGGYDSSKFIQNDLIFDFASDNERNIIVAIQSISTPSQDTSSPVGTSLLPTPIYAYLDATVPQIWLPLEACQAFELEFGLVYDNETSLYLVNETLHQDLLTRNPNITFTLGQSVTGGSTITISLPYAAFDLTATPPYQGLANQTYYFPLQRAQNDSQYTIGRTFFQEAYITVDWEAQKFNVSQCNWNQEAQTNLVAIHAYNGSTNPGATSTEKSSDSGLSSGAIAGIVIGAVAVIALLAGAIFWCHRKRRRSSGSIGVTGGTEKLVSEAGDDSIVRDDSTGQHDMVLPKSELEGSPAVGASHYTPENKGFLAPLGPGTPNSPFARSANGYFGFGESSSSPTTPSAGEGTHSSTQSGSGSGNNTLLSVVSPLSAHRTTDGDNSHIYEMPGDMPVIKEKDGKQLTEKEALAHRERVYNGVDTPPHTASSDSDEQKNYKRASRVQPEQVARSNTLLGPPAEHEQRDFGRHRAFSFEESRNDDSEELYE